MSKTNKQLLKAATTTSDLAAGGIMNEKQAAKFIQMVFDTTALLQLIRTINMPSPLYEIDKIGVGQRIMRGMEENEDMAPYTKKPIFGKIELAAKKYSLPWELSEDALEDNIEGKSLEDVIAGLFANQMGLDTEDIGVNGDRVYTGSAPASTITANIDGTTDPIDVPIAAVTGFPRNSEAGYVKINNEYLAYTHIDTLTLKACARAQAGTTIAAHTSGDAITWVRHPLIGVDDGWVKLMYSGGSAYEDLSAINSGNIKKDHFFKIFRNLPAKYRRGANKAALRWMMSSLQKSKWDEVLTDRLTSAGDAVLGGADLKPLGIPMLEVPSFPEDTMCLTYPKNLIVGIWRRIKVRKTDMDKDSIFKDLRFYNTTTRMSFQIEETEACSFGDGLVE